jgi:hypothetical protein
MILRCREALRHYAIASVAPDLNRALGNPENFGSIVELDPDERLAISNEPLQHIILSVTPL